MRILWPTLTNHLRPVLVADGNAHLIPLVRQTVDSMSRRQPLMVIEMRLALRSWRAAGRQRNALADIPSRSFRNIAPLAGLRVSVPTFALAQPWLSAS